MAKSCQRRAARRLPWLAQVTALLEQLAAFMTALAAVLTSMSLLLSVLLHAFLGK